MNRAEEIFLALADLAAEAREALIRERCGDSAPLRAEVAALLAALEEPTDEFLDPALIPTLDMSAVDGPLQPGTTLGRFLVLHALGSGGMGVVYAAQQDRPRRTVAIKVLRRGFRHPEIVKRFEREAEVLGRLQHAGIAQVFSFHPGDRTAPAHLVMELIDGPTITEYAQAHGLSIAERVELVIMLCDGVQHAHDRGVIHRDLKPGNVLVTADGRPKILDFGVARAIGLEVQSAPQTSHGQLLGTLAYMSPEQLRGATGEVDARSDVYAIGVLLFRLLAQRLPYDITGLPLFEAAQHILQTDSPPLGSIDPRCAGSLEHITARAMARDRGARYQSSTEMSRDLRAFLDGRHTISAVPPGVTIAEPLARQLVATDADGQPLPIAGVRLKEDGSLVVQWADGREQLFQSVTSGRATTPR
jgi:eukaryotic-like serine/threonine-protein kinase